MSQGRSQVQAGDGAPSQTELRESEALLRAVFDNALDAIIIVDDRGTCLEANAAASAIFGLPLTEIVGRNFADFTLPARARDVEKVRQDFLAGDTQQGVFDVRRPDGTTIVVQYTAKAHFLPGRHLSVLRDVTESTRSEQALRQSLKEVGDIRFALDASTIVAITDQRGRITYANDKFCEISKYSREELLGQDHRIINSGFHPKEFIRDLWTTISRGGVWHGEIKNRAKDGSFYWVETTIVPFLNEAGKPYQYVAIRSDITERKRLEVDMVRAAQLSLIGELAAGLAHEIKNPLAGIQGVIDVLVQRRGRDDPERLALEEVRGEVRRIDQTVRALLERARPRALRLEQASLTGTVQRAVHLAHHQAAAGNRRNGKVAIAFEPPRDPVVLLIDAAQMEDAVLNLIINAIEAIEDGRGRVTVRLGVRREGARPEAVIEVEDTGRGIAEEDLQRIFNPFFTTAEGGTGLGLAAVRRITRAHGGQVEVSSKPGHGSTFIIRLPLTAPAS